MCRVFLDAEFFRRCGYTFGARAWRIRGHDECCLVIQTPQERRSLHNFYPEKQRHLYPPIGTAPTS